MTAPIIDIAPYQQRILTDPSRLLALVKSRRIGGTWIVALREAMRSLGFGIRADGKIERSASRGSDQHIVSASQEQAMKHLDDVRTHLLALTAGSDVAKIAKDTALAITLSDGVVITAHAANPRTIRGGGGDVTLDEFGVMPFADKVWAAASPIRKATWGHTTGFELRVLGTPDGDVNKFARLFNSEDGQLFSKHKVSIYDAKAEGFPIDIEETRLEIGDPDMFEQEYNCAFLSASSRYIPASLYDGAMYFAGDAPKDACDDGYAGYDVARKTGGDKSACVELERIGDVLWVTRIRAEKGVAWDDQEAWVADVLTRRRRIAIDVSGLGQQFGERLTNRFHSSRVEGVEFTNRSKEELATGLKLAFERGRLRVPDSLDLRRDVLALRREVTAAGNTRFDAERNQHGHGDLAWALALAVHAAGGAAKSDGLSKTPRFDVLPSIVTRPGGRIVVR